MNPKNRSQNKIALLRSNIDPFALLDDAKGDNGLLCRVDATDKNSKAFSRQCSNLLPNKAYRLLKEAGFKGIKITFS
jgi:hypothetical protein